MVILLFVLHMDLLLGSCGENIDLDLHVNQENWLDPNDPFTTSSFCTKSVLEQLAVCRTNLRECLKGNPANGRVEDYTEDYVHDSTLKHIVRNFLHRMHVDIDQAGHIDRSVQVYIDAKSLFILKKYLNSESETITVREQIREILEEMVVPQHYEDVSFLERASAMVMPFLPLLNAVLIVPALIILYRSHFSIRSFVWIFLFMSFIISLFNAFHRKYQANIAARMLRAEKSFTGKCKADNFLSTAVNVVSSLFFFKEENQCEQHYKDLYVDPLYEIAPLDVICEVLSNFIFTPFGVFGRHFNIFFTEFFRDTPLQYIPVKIITLFLLLFVLLFFLGGYRIRTFLATVEPVFTTSRMARIGGLADHRHDDGIPKIGTSKLRTISSPVVNLKPVRKIASNSRRRSLSTSRLNMIRDSTPNHW